MKLIQRLFKRSSRKNRDRAGSSGTDVSLSSTTNPVGTQEDRAEYSERCRSGEIHNLNTTQEHLQGSIFSPGIEDRLGSTVMSSHKERAPQLPVEVFFDHVYHFLGEEGLRKAREVCICWQFEGAWKLLAIDRWNELRRTREFLLHIMRTLSLCLSFQLSGFARAAVIAWVEIKRCNVVKAAG